MNLRNCYLLLATLFISCIALAGNSFTSKKLKLKKIGIHMGAESDLLSINDFQGNYFSRLLIDRELSDLAVDRRNTNYNQASFLCGIPNIKVNFAFQLPKPNRELHFGIMGILDRGLVNYFTQYDVESDIYNVHDYSLHSNEIAIDANYVATKEIHLIKDGLQLNLYALGGTNVGYQYMNKVKVQCGHIQYNFISMESLLQENRLQEVAAEQNTSNTSNHIHEHYEASKAINQRIYAGVGFGLIFFNRLELGANGKLGHGYRYHFPSHFTGTKYRSFDFTAKWIL